MSMPSINSIPPKWSRPPREHWSVGPEAGGVNFKTAELLTTADLVSQSPEIPDSGTPAAYTFQRNCTLMEPAGLKGYAKAAATGAAWGGATGVAGGVGLFLLSAVAGAFTGGLGVWAVQAAPLVTSVAACTSIGATLGSVIGSANLFSEHSDYPRYGESLSGTLTSETGPDGKKHLNFHPHGSLSQKVDLEAYATAPVVDGGEPGTPGDSWWNVAHLNVQY